MTAPDRRHIPEWLKDVPPDWDIALLRLLARVESGHTPSRNHPEYWIPEECTIPWFSLADIWQLREGRQKYLGDTKEKISPLGMANSAARLLPAGTVALSRTASVGFSGIMPRPMATTQDFVNFVCGKKLLPDFLLWALRGMRSELERLRVGSTHQTIYMPDLLQFRVPVIPLPRQRAIADFLDRKTAAIDALIEKKQRLMALLEEKRKAVIHQVVTKGLNPAVPMKDSGVTWLGQIPNHWEVKRIKHVCRLETGHTPSKSIPEYWIEDECTIPWVSLNDSKTLAAKDVISDTVYKISPLGMANSSAHIINADAVVFTRDATIGLASIIERPMAVSQHIIAWVCGPTIFNKYLLRVIDAMTMELNRVTFGATIKTIGMGDVKQLVTPVPPLSEQQAIVTDLGLRLRHNDRIVASLREQLARLAEYRQSLITAAVTGQLPIEASP